MNDEKKGTLVALSEADAGCERVIEARKRRFENDNGYMVDEYLPWTVGDLHEACIRLQVAGAKNDTLVKISDETIRASTKDELPPTFAEERKRKAIKVWTKRAKRVGWTVGVLVGPAALLLLAAGLIRLYFGVVGLLPFGIPFL